MMAKLFDRQVLHSYFDVVVKDETDFKIVERWEMVSWNGGRPQFEMRRFIRKGTEPEKVYKLVALKNDYVDTFNEVWPQIQADFQKESEAYEQKKKARRRNAS